MSPWRDIARGAAAVAATAVAVALIACIAVSAAGAAAEARGWFAFGFAAPRGRLADAAQIALDNIRLAAAPFLGACAIRYVPKLRPFIDFVLALLLGMNAALLGAAFAAYGPELVSVLVPHLLLEFAAFSLAGGTYVSARQKPLRLLLVVFAIAATGCLLVAAAGAETALWLG